MCVIMYIEGPKRPSSEMVAKAYARNSHGGGLAWREKMDDGTTEVVWRKGLKLEEMQKLMDEMPLPMVAHFRISSNERPPKPQLCHPFPVEKEAQVWLAGRTGGQVLFHNGHWGEWKKGMLEGASRFATRLPEGKMSDTRAMAFLSSLYGTNFMEVIEEKGIIFGPTDEETDLFWGTGWYNVEDIWCSNLGFTSETVNTNDPTGAYSNPTHNPVGIYPHNRDIPYRGRVELPECKMKQCWRRDVDSTGFCPMHTAERPNFPFRDGLREGTVPATPNTGGVLVKDGKKIGMPGGASANTPFAKLTQVKENFQKGVPGKGKRALKRAQKQWEKEQRLQEIKREQQEAQARRREAAKPKAGQLSTEPPVIVKGLLQQKNETVTLH